VWQTVAACCSVLQCDAVCCSVLQHAAVCCSTLQFVVVCTTSLDICVYVGVWSVYVYKLECRCISVSFFREFVADFIHLYVYV